MYQRGYQRPYFNRRSRWFGFYSQDAVDAGCPVYVYQHRDGTIYSVTCLTQRRDGYGYYWPDKIMVGEVTNLRYIETVGFNEEERPVPDGIYLNGRSYNG